MKNHLGRDSPSHFLQNVLIQTSNASFKSFEISCLVLCHFLMSWSLKDSKHIKRHIPLLPLTITNKGGICISKACL